MAHLAASSGCRYPTCVKKDTSVNIRLTSELRAELQRLADEDGRKLSAYIERLLQLHVRGGDDQQAGLAADRAGEAASTALDKLAPRAGEELAHQLQEELQKTIEAFTHLEASTTHLPPRAVESAGEARLVGELELTMRKVREEMQKLAETLRQARLPEGETD